MLDIDAMERGELEIPDWSAHIAAVLDGRDGREPR
jgi:hypothetical protein